MRFDCVGLKAPFWYREIAEDFGSEQPVGYRSRFQKLDETMGERKCLLLCHA
jgi:hypothetical protein